MNSPCPFPRRFSTVTASVSSISMAFSCTGRGLAAISINFADNLSVRASCAGPYIVARSFALFRFLVVARSPFAMSQGAWKLRLFEAVSPVSVRNLWQHNPAFGCQLLVFNGVRRMTMMGGAAQNFEEVCSSEMWVHSRRDAVHCYRSPLPAHFLRGTPLVHG